MVASLGRRGVTQAFRRPQFLAPILMFPSLFLAINTGGAGRATAIPGFPHVHGFLDFQLAGAMMQSTMLGGLSGAIALALDIESGFMDRLVASPAPRWVIVLGRLVATGVMGILTGVWFLAIGLIFGAHVAGGVPGALLVVALTFLAAMGFGALGAALALLAGRASVAQGFFPIVFVILFLSSAFFPGNLLLEPAKTISDWNPMSYIADGIRAPIVDGLELRPTLECLAAILGVGLMGALASTFAFRRRVTAG